MTLRAMKLSMLRHLAHKVTLEKWKAMEPIIYHTVDSILDVFNDEKHKNTAGVSKLLKVYGDLVTKASAENVQKKHPLIVLEGLDGCGKSTLTRELAKKINASLYRTPPKSLGNDIRALFDDNKTLRTAYYALGNYIGALEMLFLLQEKPVVLDRYWHSTAAYAIAQAVQDNPELYEMPLEGNNIYTWPEDLMKPDLVILLEVSEEERLRRHSRRKVVTKQEDLMKSNNLFRENILSAYKCMENPGITFMNGDPTIHEVLNDLHVEVKNLL